MSPHHDGAVLAIERKRPLRTTAPRQKRMSQRQWLVERRLGHRCRDRGRTAAGGSICQANGTAEGEVLLSR